MLQLVVVAAVSGGFGALAGSALSLLGAAAERRHSTAEARRDERRVVYDALLAQHAPWQRRVRMGPRGLALDVPDFEALLRSLTEDLELALSRVQLLGSADVVIAAGSLSDALADALMGWPASVEDERRVELALLSSSRHQALVDAMRADVGPTKPG